MTEAVTTRCGFVAIIGAPNAGKSTLVNKLVGSKISIVSHKVQTTRARIRAIYMHEQSQVVLVDTPGIFKPRRKLDEAMVQSAWTGAGEADAVVHDIFVFFRVFDRKLSWGLGNCDQRLHIF